MSYEPIKVNGPQNLYKTPIWVKSGDTGIWQDKLTVWVGRKIVRYFEPDQLPDEIKAKLAFVLATDRLGTRLLGDDDLTYCNSWNFHTSTVPTEYPYLSDIGWRVSKSCICLIVSGDLIFRLRGE